VVAVVIRVVYRGGSSRFFGIGILSVSDILGIGVFGRYSRCVGKISSFMVCRTPDPVMVGMRG
jgi:hypothetical protein